MSMNIEGVGGSEGAAGGDSKEPKKPNLEPEQEAGLRGLIPDFEPKKGAESAKGKTEKEPAKEQVAIVSMLYAGLFGILASRLGDHWALTEQEIAALAVPTDTVIEKYFPDAKVGVELALLSAVVMVVLPRAIVTIQQKPIDGEVEGNGDKSESDAAK